VTHLADAAQCIRADHGAGVRHRARGLHRALRDGKQLRESETGRLKRAACTGLHKNAHSLRPRWSQRFRQVG